MGEMKKKMKTAVRRRLKGEQQKVNILLVELINRNLGDTVIADTATYLTKRGLPLFSRSRFHIQAYNICSEDYEMVRLADMIIFDGGGLVKYKQEKFYGYIIDLLEQAERYHKPVFFNGVGVEGYDEDDERCQNLKQALNLPCVKGISVRDDLETLRRDYIVREDLESFEVPDPAVYTPEVYQIRRDPDSRVIGLGVARHMIFADYGNPEITREVQLDFWRDTARELEKMGYHWKVFVNGLRADYDFAKEVVEYLGHGDEMEEYLVKRPTETGELVGTIASFAGIVACRMHANIIAYALQVPSIGLVWNEKLAFWGQRIGYPQRFLRPQEFQGETIARAMDQAVKEGVKLQPDSFRRQIYLPLRRFIHRYGREALRRKKRLWTGDYDWSQKLAATALGGKCLQYTNMNTPETVSEKLAHGYRWFEADVRMTRDNRLVCVNGWSENSWQKMNLAEPYPGPEGMDYEEFMKCSYYDGHYPTMDVYGLFEILRQNPQMRLILDLGRPAAEVMEQIVKLLERPLGDDYDLLNRVMIRVQRRRDVDTFKASDVPFVLMFYIPPEPMRSENNITVDTVYKYCKRQEIRWVSLGRETFDEEISGQLAQRKIKVCVFTHNNLTDVIDCINRGADLVASHFLNVDEVRDMTQGTLGGSDEQSQVNL